MSASYSTHSPLTRFVLFMVCLTVAGAGLATVHYYVVDLPAQISPGAPANNLDADELQEYNFDQGEPGLDEMFIDLVGSTGNPDIYVNGRP
jgi:hypothetical protein